MADSYRTGGGQYYDARGGYVGGATYKFDQLGRIIGGIGPNGEDLDETGRIRGFDYAPTGGNSTYNLNNARGLNPAASQGGSASIATGGQPAAVTANRAAMFDALKPGQGYFGGPLGQQTSNAISGAMSGADVPYTQGVQDRLFGQAADLNAGTRGAQDDLIRRQLAERGMEGSGGGIAAMLGAGRDMGAANSQALSSIQNTAQLENYSARERARTQGESFLASRSSAEAPYRLKEADLRFNSDFTQDNPFASALTGLGGFQKRGATGQPQQGTQMGLGTGGAFNLSRPTVGPGSGSNTGVSAGGTPTQAPQVGGYARQAQQTQATAGRYSPFPGLGSNTTPTARQQPLPGLGASPLSNPAGYDPWKFSSSKGW